MGPMGRVPQYHYHVKQLTHDCITEGCSRIATHAVVNNYNDVISSHCESHAMAKCKNLNT